MKKEKMSKIKIHVIFMKTFWSKKIFLAKYIYLIHNQGTRMKSVDYYSSFYGISQKNSDIFYQGFLSEA